MRIQFFFHSNECLRYFHYLIKSDRYPCRTKISCLMIVWLNSGKCFHLSACGLIRFSKWKFIHLIVAARWLFASGRIWVFRFFFCSPTKGKTPILNENLKRWFRQTSKHMKNELILWATHLRIHNSPQKSTIVSCLHVAVGITSDCKIIKYFPQKLANFRRTEQIPMPSLLLSV